MTTKTTSDTAFAQELVSRSLDHGAQEAQVNVSRRELLEINFDRDEVLLVRTNLNTTTSLTLFAEGRKGSAQFNGESESAVLQALAAARDSMEASPADPAFGIATGNPTDPVVLGPGDPDRDQMARAVSEFQQDLKKRWPEIHTDNCHHDFHRGVSTFANSAGVVREETRSLYSLSVMFTGRRDNESTSFNYMGLSQFDPFTTLSAPSVARALDDTCHSFSPAPVPHKFTGTLIFTPESLDDLLGAVCGALSGYQLISGGTPYQDSQGDAIASPHLTVRNAPRDPGFPGGSHFDGYGIPTEDRLLIDGGVLKDFLIDHYASRKLDRPMTAGAVNLIVEPGTSPLEEIIRKTDEGIVMGRFSGGQPNNNLDFSGIAKNSFYVKDGEIRQPLMETMVSGNFGDLIRSIRGISRETCNNGSSSHPWVAAEGAVVAAG